MESNLTFLSIIIPVYNSYNKIEKCLDSIESQTNLNFEVIFVDDASTDKTYQYLEEYLKRTNIKYKLIGNKENKGPGAARNIGLMNATGEYVTFIDSDDYIRNDTVNILYGIYSNSKPDCICFDYIRKEYNSEKKVRMIDNVDYGDVKIKKAFVNCKGSIWGKVFKLSLLKENNIIFPNLNRNEDMPFAKVAISYSKSVYYSKQPLYYYVINRSSLMHNDKLTDENNAIKALEYIEQRASDEVSDVIEDVFIKECIYSNICTAINKGYSRKKIIQKIKEQEKKYPRWTKNKVIKQLPFHIYIVLRLYQLKLILLIRLIFKFKKLIIKRKWRYEDKNKH